MLADLKHYFVREARPRHCRIICSSDFVLAAVIAIAAAYLSPRFGLTNIKISTVAGAFLNYSAIAFGFAVTGMTLAISIPSKELAVKMAKQIMLPHQKSAYSDLIFVFSWTAMAHLLSIVVSIAFLAAFPDAQTILSAPPLRIERLILGAATFLATYSIAQFAITIVTISQVGSVYIHELQKEP